MIYELLSQIGLLIFLLALIGYLAKEFYNLGYYGVSYRPFSHSRGIERLLKFCSHGMLLVLLAIIIYALIFQYDSSLILPEELGKTSIPPEWAEKVTVYLFYSYLLAIFIPFIFYLIILSVVIGRIVMLSSAVGVLIEKTDKSEPIYVREIYDENDDFLFYLDLKGKWGSIRKEVVDSLKYAKKDSILDQTIKNFKKKIL